MGRRAEAGVFPVVGVAVLGAVLIIEPGIEALRIGRTLRMQADTAQYRIVAGVDAWCLIESTYGQTVPAVDREVTDTQVFVEGPVGNGLSDGGGHGW